MRRIWEKACLPVLAAVWMLAFAVNFYLFYGADASAGQTLASVLYILVWVAAALGVRNWRRWLKGLLVSRAVLLFALLAGVLSIEPYALWLVCVFLFLLPYYGIIGHPAISQAVGTWGTLLLLLGVQPLIGLLLYLRQRKREEKQDPAA